MIDHINSTIRRFYDDPANAGLPYELAEGGWQGKTWYTYEIFQELDLDFPNDKEERLREAISDGLDTDLWSEAEPFMLSPDQRLHFSWEEFCRRIKHQRRYFFLHEESKKKKRAPWNDDELYSPAEIPDKIFSYAKDAEVFITVPAGTSFFRARHQPAGKSYMTAATLGPPPEDNAIKTNRMSPPGVVMTYVADDRDTALAETADAPGTFAVGEFVIGRDLVILDLTRLPPIPSVFSEVPDSLPYDPRLQITFLHRIGHEISRAIARDDRVHVEYVPTQVVTEYVRTIVRIYGKRADGIRYKSSRRHTGTALVLFANQNDLVLENGERPELYFPKDRWLRLAKAGRMKVTDDDIKRWASKPRRHLFALT